MGVDTRIYLPSNVRVRDVANVIGILFGLKPEKHELSSSHGWAVGVPGVTVSSCSRDENGQRVFDIPECAEISLKGKTIIGKDLHILYHFEAGQDKGRLMMPRSFPFWIAVGRRLVEFFGGEMDYDDRDDVTVDYTVQHKSWKENASEEDKEWQHFQQRLLCVKPLTKAEIKACREFAACKD